MSKKSWAWGAPAMGQIVEKIEVTGIGLNKGWGKGGRSKIPAKTWPMHSLTVIQKFENVRNQYERDAPEDGFWPHPAGT